jgi:hypothetical protein
MRLRACFALVTVVRRVSEPRNEKNENNEKTCQEYVLVASVFVDFDLGGLVDRKAVAFFGGSIIGIQ